MMIWFGLLTVGAYFLGALPLSYLAAKWQQDIDLRQYGTGQVGTGNLWRMTANWKIGLPIGVFDLGKGMLMVWVARLVGLDISQQMVVGLAAIVGHDWSLYLDGRGGRGVGPSFAVLLLFSPLVALAGLVVFGLVILWKRYVSLGSLTGTAAALVGVVLAVVMGGQPAAYLGFALVAAPLIFFQHRDNIQRLLAGTERRLGEPVTPR